LRKLKVRNLWIQKDTNESVDVTDVLNALTGSKSEYTNGLAYSAVFQHGTYNTAIAYGAQTDFLVLKSMHVTGSSSSYIMGDVNRFTTSAASTGYVHLGYNYLSVGHNLANGYAMRSRIAMTASSTPGEQVSCLATMEIAAGIALAAGSALRAGLFELSIGAGATIEQETHCVEIRPLVAANVAGVTSGIRININCSSANYVDYGLDIRSMSSNQTAAIRILATPATAALAAAIIIEGQHSSTSTITSAIKINGDITNVLDFSGATDTYGYTDGKTGSTQAGHIRILDSTGAIGYINVYSATD
jgi:hypothetical protein